MSSLKKDFFTGLFTGAGGFILKAGSNILLIPFLIQFLGSENFGFFIFLLTFAEFLLIMDVGLTSGLIHRLSHYLTIDDLACIHYNKQRLLCTQDCNVFRKMFGYF